MTIQLDIGPLIALMSLPSAFTGLCVWMLQRSITKRDAKRDAKRDKQEEARKKNEYLVIKGVGAAIALGEATAHSIRRLDTCCNGEMTRALEYAQQVKHEQKDFLNTQGIENLY